MPVRNVQVFVCFLSDEHRELSHNFPNYHSPVEIFVFVFFGHCFGLGAHNFAVLVQFHHFNLPPLSVKKIWLYAAFTASPLSLCQCWRKIWLHPSSFCFRGKHSDLLVYSLNQSRSSWTALSPACSNIVPANDSTQEVEGEENAR